MKGDLYFKNVPDTGSLFMEQVLFSYENIPIVFVCTNNNDLRYLCVCDDIIEEESWIIVKITNLKLLEILDDKSTVLSAFVGKTIVLATSDLNNHHMQYNVMDYNEINKDELPICDQYLEMKDHLKNYIEKIANEISSATLKISLPFHDIRTNEPNIPQIKPTLEKTIKTELHYNLYEHAGFSNLVKCSSDDCFSMQFNCKTVYQETSNVFNSLIETDIVFAA